MSSDPTLTMDVETALVGWQRERNCDDITHVKGAGEHLAAALRTEQSARQAEKAERLVDHEKGAAFHARAIVAEGERHDLQQRIDALMECPQAIHGSFTRTPNGKCPWCEWEDLQQRIDAALKLKHGPFGPWDDDLVDWASVVTALTASTESKEPEHEQ
jgi:hypothetical protein